MSILLSFSYCYAKKKIFLDILSIKKYVIDTDVEIIYFSDFVEILFSFKEYEFLLNLRNIKTNKVQISTLDYIISLKKSSFNFRKNQKRLINFKIY